MRLVAAVAALWLCVLPSALAQSENWLVLPTTTEEEARWMVPTVDKVGRELRRQGIGVWSPERAGKAFEARGSSSPPVVSEDRIETWADRSQQGLRSLAAGDYTRPFEARRGSCLFARQFGDVEPQPRARANRCRYLSLLGAGPRRHRRRPQRCGASSRVRSLRSRGNAHAPNASSRCARALRSSRSAEPGPFEHVARRKRAFRMRGSPQRHPRGRHSVRGA